MEEIVFKSDDIVVMNLINYFVTEENYNPMIIHGINNEIWLENLDNEYKIIRIVSHHIHNKEQLEFDKFKLGKIIKQVKRKTLSFKINVLNIYTDVEDEKILKENDVLITKENDIDTSKLKNIFPNIIEKTKRKEDGLEYFIKVTDNINKKNEKRTKMAEKIFSYKKPIVTYIIIGICSLLFALMYLLGNGSENTNTLIDFGTNYGIFVKNGEYFRLVTSMFLHIGIFHLLCNMYSLYVIGKEIENIYGKIKYIIIFLLSGICGGLLSIAFNDNVVSAGASGAIFGLLGSLLYFGMHYRAYLGNTVRSSILPIIIINLVIGFMIPGIDVVCHIGGLIGGIFVSMMVGMPDKSKKQDRINGIILTTIYILFMIFLLFYRR